MPAESTPGPGLRAIYLDAIVCKVRHEGIVGNKAAYLAVGIDVDGRKDVLGIWIDATEGAKQQLRDDAVVLIHP